MGRVRVTVSHTEILNDSDRYQDGITVTCTKCDASVEVFGQHDASIRRGCVMLKEQCRFGHNYYYADEDEDVNDE